MFFRSHEVYFYYSEACWQVWRTACTKPWTRSTSKCELFLANMTLFCRFMKLVNSVINFDTVHFHSGSNKFANSLALFFQMFRLLNFKWDGSHRVRPSCDNFRSKLVDPSFTQESESAGNTPQKPINTVQNSEQDDYELQVSQLEEFCAKMTQYQAHMKALEGTLMQKKRKFIQFFRTEWVSCRPKCSIQGRKLQTKSKTYSIRSSDIFFTRQ